MALGALAYRKHADPSRNLGTVAPSGALYAMTDASVDEEAQCLAVAKHTPRTTNLLLVSPSDGAYPDESGQLSGGDTYLTAVGHTPTYQFGLGNVTGRMYRRKKDGSDSWTLCASTKVLQMIWGLSDGSVIGGVNFQSPGNVELWHSADLGENWTKVIDKYSGAGVKFSQYGYLHVFSFGEGTGGSAMLAEYGDPADQKGRYVFHSADYGRTWTVAWDQNTQASTPYYHHHAVGYQRALGKFVVSCGDSRPKSRILRFNADGTGGVEFIAPVNCDIQPTAYLDYYHPTDILCGADDRGQVYRLNVSTGALTSAFEGFNRTFGNNFCWLLFEAGGLYFACSYADSTDATSANEKKEPVLAVAEHPHGPWNIYYRGTADERGAECFAGVRLGKISLSYRLPTIVLKHLQVSLPSTRQVSGVFIEPKNVSISSSTLTTSITGWYNPSGGTVEVAAAAGIQGDNCIKFTSDGDAAVFEMHFTGVGNKIIDKCGMIDCWMKADDDISLTVKARRASDTGFSHPVVVALRANQWTHVVLGTILTTTPTVGDRIDIHWELSGNENAAVRQIWIDRIHTSEVSYGSWCAGTATREDDRHDVTYDVGTYWTEIFDIAPYYASHLLAHSRISLAQDTRLYIRRWVKGSTSAELYLDFGARGTLASIVGGTTVNANEAIFHPGMVGSMLYFPYSAGPKNSKIVTYNSTTQVVVQDNVTGYGVATDRIWVNCPRFVLRVTAGGPTDYLYSPARSPVYAKCPLRFAVCLGDTGASAAKLRAFVANGGPVAQFVRSDYATFATLNAWAALANDRITVTAGAPDTNELLTLAHHLAIGGIYGHLTDAQVATEMARVGSVRVEADQWYGGVK